MVFDRSVTLQRVKYLWEYCLPSFEFDYLNNQHEIHLLYPCANLGGSFPFEADVIDSNGNKLTAAFTIDFFLRKKVIEGHITDFFMDTQTGLYWASTREPHRIYAISVDDLQVKNRFDLDFLPGKIRYNRFNNRLYILSLFPAQNYFDSNIYVMDISNGKIIETIPNNQVPDDHPQYPAIYPYDIAFFEDGHGIILLMASQSSNRRWKIIDSSKNHEMHFHPKSTETGFYAFEKAYLSFDEKKIILNSGYDHYIFIFDSNTRNITMLTPIESTTNVRYLVPHRKNNKTFVACSRHQYITDYFGNAGIALFNYLGGINVDFCYKQNQENLVYYLNYSDIALINFNNHKPVIWYKSLSVMRGITSTIDGNYLLTYRLKPVKNDFIYSTSIFQFSTDLFDQ